MRFERLIAYVNQNLRLYDNLLHALPFRSTILLLGEGDSLSVEEVRKFLLPVEPEKDAGFRAEVERLGRRGVGRIFVLAGFALGGLGTALGCGAGALACFLLDRYRLNLPGDVYFIETLPVYLWWGDVAMVATLALAICLLSALYPSWRASRLTPVEAIRYE